MKKCVSLAVLAAASMLLATGCGSINYNDATIPDLHAPHRHNGTVVLLSVTQTPDLPEKYVFFSGRIHQEATNQSPAEIARLSVTQLLQQAGYIVQPAPPQPPPKGVHVAVEIFGIQTFNLDQPQVMGAKVSLHLTVTKDGKSSPVETFPGRASTSKMDLSAEGFLAYLSLAYGDASSQILQRVEAVAP